MMNWLSSLALFLLVLPCNSQERKNIELLDSWSEDTLITSSTLVRYSGCWGFEREGKEYAVIGSTEGTHFFFIQDDNTLQPAGFVEGQFNSAQVIHREFKTFGNYAYSVCDEGMSSLQIIDLSYLPDSVVKVADIQDSRFGKVHNLFIDTANALLYACMVTPIVAGNPLSLVPMRVFSLIDPLDPQLLWEGPSDIPEVHDCYVRNNIAYLNCGFDGLRVYDFSDPINPVYKSNLTFYPEQGYNHQGWLSPDGKTYVFADETNGKRIKRCRVNSDLSISITGYFGTNSENGTVPHNINISDEFAFVAYYNEGLRIYDLRTPVPTEIGAFDTYLPTTTFQMNGAWGVFAGYSSERIIVSDRQYGLFLFQFDRELFRVNADSAFLTYPNPVNCGEDLIIRSPDDEITDFSITIFNGAGEKVCFHDVSQQSYFRWQAPETGGFYFLKIIYQNYLGETVMDLKKILVIN